MFNCNFAEDRRFLKRIHSVAEQVAKHAGAQPEKIAIVSPEGSVTYGEFYGLISGFANYLKEIGLRKGDFLICRATSDVSYLVTFLGTQLAGGIFVPLEKDCTKEKIITVSGRLGGVLFVVSTSADRDVVPGAFFIASDQIIALAEKYFRSGIVFDFPGEDAVGQILFTTGTTGREKGVVMPLVQLALVGEQFDYSGADRMLISTPVNHILAFGRSNTMLYHGGTVVLTDGVGNLARFYAALSENKANCMATTPSVINYLATLTEDELKKYTGQLRCIEIGGEKMPRELQRRLLKILPETRLFIGYGSTETGAVCCYEFSKYGTSDNRIGKPFTGAEIFFLDENWSSVQATKESPGYISVRAKGLMKEYWDDKAETEKAMQNGVIKTSDCGYVDEDGFICITGRSGDVIISGGQKIDPTEVEAAALSCDGLADCVCVGKKDEVFGFIVRLLVVMKPGVAFDRAEIGQFLAERLESFKVPRFIEETKEIKRNKNGKTDRKYYREEEK